MLRAGCSLLPKCLRAFFRLEGLIRDAVEERLDCLKSRRYHREDGRIMSHAEASYPMEICPVMCACSATYARIFSSINGRRVPKFFWDLTLTFFVPFNGCIATRVQNSFTGMSVIFPPRPSLNK